MRTIKFHKAECGVEVLLQVGLGHLLPESYLDPAPYNTGYFEILLFKKGRGHVVLNQQPIAITDNTIVFTSPFQKRQWRLAPDHLEFTVLIFQMALLEASGKAKVIAVHMDALDHCRTSRASLRKKADAQHISARKLLIPQDGETVAL